MADGVPITAGSGTTILTDDTGAGGHAQVMKLAISTDGSGTLIPADSANGLDVDVTRVSGNVTVVQPTASNLNANVSGTVDATQSGTWNVGLNAGSNAIGSITNTTFAATQSGSWSVGLNAGSNAIGSITNTSFAATQSTASSLLNKPYGAVTTAAPSYTNGTDDALSLTTSGALRVDGSAATQPVSGTVTANAGTGSFTVAQATAANLNATVTVSGVADVEGNLAHDDPDSGNPVKVGAKAVAHGTNPAAVAAADRTNLYANRHGILFTIGGHPNIITRAVRIADADGAQTNASMVGTINTGTKVAVTAMAVTVDSATTATGGVAVKVGFGATTIPADSTTGADGVLLDHDGIAAGSGVVIGNGSGILGIGADGEELRLTCEDPVGGSLIVTFSYFTIES